MNKDKLDKEYSDSLKAVYLNPREIEAIGNVVNSFADDEERDYEQYIEDGGEPEDHVYKDLEILEKLYNKLKRK